ncbi:MAG: site-specific integrase [Bacteroidetes bacterium]|nr:site-specific integrase [Bacteroidota bacterium]
MKTHASLYLDVRRKNVKGLHPVVICLYHRKQRYYFTTKYWIKKDFWDDKEQRILNKAKVNPSVGAANLDILEQKVKINNHITRLEQDGELNRLTPLQLKNRISNKTEKIDFYTYLDRIIKELRTQGREGNAGVYAQTIDFIKRYVPDKTNLAFEDINVRLLKDIEARYMARDNSLNGLAIYLRTIRSIFNKAITDGLVTKDLYPFEEYKIKKEKSHKTAISKTQIESIRDLSLKENTLAWHGRNIFLLSFYCRGMNFKDLAEIKLKDCTNGKILYRRSKTSRQIIIKINDKIQGIIDLYSTGKKNEDYLLPVISDKHIPIAKQVTDYRNAVNHALKRWARQLGIDSSLSFYTARHSWANIGKELNLPIAVISEGLGHSDIRTTQIYLDSFNAEIIDDASQQIIS